MSAKHPGRLRLTPGTCDLGYIRVFGVEVIPLGHYRSIFITIAPIAAASSHLKRSAAGKRLRQAVNLALKRSKTQDSVPTLYISEWRSKTESICRAEALIKAERHLHVHEETKAVCIHSRSSDAEDEQQCLKSTDLSRIGLLFCKDSLLGIAFQMHQR